MKLFLECDDGRMVEVKEIEGVSSENDVLVMFTKSMPISAEVAKNLADSFYKQLGMKVVILPPNVTKIVGITRPTP